MKKKQKLILSVIAAATVASALFACGDKSSDKKPQAPDATPLAAPVIALDGNTVSWSAVEHATGYDVYVDGSGVASVTTTSYSLGGITAAGTYEVKVRATSTDKAYSASAFSEPVTYTVAQDKTPLAVPALSVSGTTVTWSAVDNASGYAVYVDGSLHGTVTEPAFDASGLAVGAHEIRVVALATGSVYADSAKSAAVTVSVPKKVSGLALLSPPDVTEYKVGASALDLTGLTAEIRYANAPAESVTLTAADIITDYDLSTAGRYEIEFEKNGAVGAGFRIYVNAGSVVKAEYRVENFYAYTGDANNTGVGTWTAPAALDVVPGDLSFTPTSATASGSPLTLTGGKVPSNALNIGENAVTLTDGEHTATVNVVVAYGIDSAGAWLSMANGLDKYYVLTADIDFGSGTKKQIGAAPLKLTWGTNPDTGAATLDDVKLDRSGTGDDGAEGVAFIGVIDGAGHSVTGVEINKGVGQYGWNTRHKGCGTAMIGWLGKSGVVKNMLIQGATVLGMDYSSILVGYNEGLIENVTIADDCVVVNQYSHGAIVSAYNYGTVKNVVSYITGGIRGSSEVALDFVRRDGDNTGERGINCFVGDAAKTDLRPLLGDGWRYLNGYGTVYCTDSFKTVVDFDELWYAGVNAEVTILAASDDLNMTYAHCWGAYSGAVTISGTVKNGNFYTYRLKIPSGTVGGGLSVSFRFDGGAYCCNVKPTVGAPFVTAIDDATGGGVTAVAGAAIRLADVAITLRYTDGSTVAGNPTGYVAGTYDNRKTDVVQNVTFYYLSGDEYLYTVIPVTAEEPQGDYVTDISVTKKSGVTAIAYGASAINFDDYLTFKLKYKDGREEEVTAASAGIVAGEYKSGKVTVGFTYENANGVTADGSIELEIWKTVTTVAEFDAINDNLSGYYVLGGDIDFGNTQHSVGCAPLTDNGSGTFCDLADGLKTGVAFTGKFDGAGHTLSGFKSAYALAFTGESFGRTLFNYIGAGGEVYNFTVSGFDVKSTNYSAFVAACNSGTVRDITVVGGTIAANYGAAGAFASYNAGTVQNCTCDITKFTKPDGSGENDLKAVGEDNGTVTDCTVGQ